MIDEQTPSAVEEVEAPTDLASLEKEGQAIRERLVADRDAANAGVEAQPQAETPAPDTETPPAEEKTVDGKPRNDKGQFLKKDAAHPEVQQQVEQPADTSAETKYAKAKKDAERKDRSWRKLEEEKAQFQQQRAQYEQQQRAFAEQIQKQQQQAQQQLQERDSGKFSAEEFERAAEWYDAEAQKAVNEGDIEKYQQLVKNAGLTRKAAKETAARQAQAQQQNAERQFRSEYEASYARACEKNPDLATPETEIGKRMLALLQEQPVLQVLPDGFERGYELLQLRDKAAAHDDAVARADKAEKEVARLTKLMQPGAGGPVAPLLSGENADTMPLEQLGNKLREKVYSGGVLLR